MEVTVEASVGYFEAWWLWWQGYDLKSFDLYGYPLIWISRFAKIATFVAGLVVVIDILGPERVKLRARELVPDESRSLPWFVLVGVIAIFWFISSGPPLQFAVVGGFAILPLAACAIGGLVVMFWQLREAIAMSFDSDSDQRYVRWVSFAVIAIGFHFDLLTS